MIIDQTLRKTETTSTVEAKHMTVSADASKLFFKMFIKNTYSNPIGSICREVSSNCFDSHIEAKVNKPIIIRKGEDENTHSPYISFIDFGVGLSPQRMEEVYCVLMTSTKRDSNDQIGGFGLGSKSILAYNRQLAYGSGETDNSFFVITISEGIKYTYLVYEGEESPMLSLLHTEETTEHNGTEIRVPILAKDEYKFNNELLKQLYYFENIIFENISDSSVTNNYQILRAKNFLYRGDAYSSYMHICLGKVAYPINFDILGLDMAEYQYPVAINFEIGELNVITSREAIDYSDDTIVLIKKKLNSAKEELLDMLSKQYDNIVTLEDYFKFIENYKVLKLSDSKSINFRNLELDKIKLKNFKYSHIKNVPKSNALFDILYRNKEYTSEKSKRRRVTEFNGDYFELQYDRKAYVYDGRDLPEKRNIKLNYLKYIHTTFHLISKRKISLESIKSHFNYSVSELAVIDDKGNTTYSSIYDDILDILNDYETIVESKIKKYDDVVVSQSYLDSIKKKRNFIKGSLVINIVTKGGAVNKSTIELTELAKFKGTIVYGNPDELYELKNATRAFGTLFSPNAEVVKWKSYNGFESENKRSNQHHMVLFICVANGNIKKLASIEDTIHVSEMYNRFFHRKEDNVLLGKYVSDINDKLIDLDNFYKNNKLDLVYPILSSYVEEIRRFINKNRSVLNLNSNRWDFSRYYDYSKFKKTNEHKKLEKMFEGLNYIQELNKEILACFRSDDLTNKTLVDLLKKSLVSETF